MRAVENDTDWTTRGVVDGSPKGKFKAREMFSKIAHTTWICGDPGIQFDTTINDWHTSSNTDRIYASNPCVTGDSACSQDLIQRLEDSGSRRTGRQARGEKVRTDTGGSTPTSASLQRSATERGRKQVFELRTASGDRLRLTADHKVLGHGGDVPADRLTTGTGS